ncbi:YolD-like family protein [Paenibacillus sp. N3/727]|uniref:YolD-like family protein n=1 Tax=Paenibacillus sp. N3/727 TaxID=2925845 RepID=UPI001F532F10|nr:YolD-like family protein [Paenibacillus sp. N3/727]UNK20259.1 YolD-like family protein [Paenibacillus sp. N3/727]
MKKLTGNGLWESSRMMLFEHRDAILAKQEQKHKQEHPFLDEQQVEWIAEKLSLAYHNKGAVQLQVFGEYGDYNVTGMVDRIDSFKQRIYIHGSWIPLCDILEALDIDLPS